MVIMTAPIKIRKKTSDSGSTVLTAIAVNINEVPQSSTRLIRRIQLIRGVIDFIGGFYCKTSLVIGLYFFLRQGGARLLFFASLLSVECYSLV